MRRTFISLLMLMGVLALQAQIDFKLHFANNVGDVANLSRIKDANSGLTWHEISDGHIAGNRNDMEPVKQMFKETRQKTLADQKLFWKMRDDNLLCFRINDGSGRHGEFEARIRSGNTILMKNVTSYFFANTDNHNDSLFITVNRKGCSASPSDTLHLKYYIYDWDNDQIYTFKLDSRRQKTGLTYQLQLVTENDKTVKNTTTLELSGSNFQTFYRPANQELIEAYLVNNDKRLKLNIKRLVNRVNLSNKLNRLWMGTNFTLDKHKNRELTIFNMLGSGLFEQYDTLYLQILGKNGPIQAAMDPQTKLAQGFTLNICEVDANGKYKKSEGQQMKYAGYNPKTCTHKILTYGSPCYIEVFAPKHYPAIYKYAGAFDPKTKVLSADRVTGTLRLIEGTTTATGPDISSQVFYTLKNNETVQEYDGKTHKVFIAEANDMGIVPPSGFYPFIEDGGFQTDPKLLNGKPIEKYAEIAIEYSMPKGGNTAGNVAQLQFTESGSSGSPIKATPSKTEALDGNDYPGFQRSWYTLRWNMVGVLPKKSVNYKPKLTIGTTEYNKLPFLKRVEFNEEESKKKAQDAVEEFAFKRHMDFEFNNMGAISFLGALAKWDMRLDDFPGIQFSVIPYLDILRGIAEVDVYLSVASRQTENSSGEKTHGQKFRENIKEKARNTRSRRGEVNLGEKLGDAEIGQDLQIDDKSAKLDKDHWVQAEMDDIFKVEYNKLGWGFGFDGHFGVGMQLPWNIIDGTSPKPQPYLKAVEAYGTFGYYLTYNWDIPWLKSVKIASLKAFANFVAQAKVGLGMKTYNFQKTGGVIDRRMGFFLNGLVQIKGGLGVVIGLDFSGKDNNNQGNQPIIDDENPVGGGDEGNDLLLGAPKRKAALARAEQKPNYASSTVNRWFSLSANIRGGAKVQFNAGLVLYVPPMKPNLTTMPITYDEPVLHTGASFLAMAAIEGGVDLKIGPFARFNPRISLYGSYFAAWPDSETNPTIPIYPNYRPSSGPSYMPRTWRAPVAPTFPLGKCIMDGLSFHANPLYLGIDNNFVMVSNSTGSNLNDNQLTEYDEPTADNKLNKADGYPVSPDGHYVQHHNVSKEGPNEMVVYEEMTRPFSDDLMQGEPDNNKDLGQGRYMQIASSLRSETTGEWKHHVVAYDENLYDSDPIVAINIFTEDNATAVPGEEDMAACVWKRGLYVEPPYDETDAANEETMKNIEEMKAEGMYAFEGDVMLSVFDQDKWGAPESLIKLEKEDILSDYQVLMRNDTVLVALSVIPKDKTVAELRYYCKPAEEPVRYVGTDKTAPVRFSLDLVGAMPTIAILNQIDSVNKDIYVKQIDMMGRYMGYGTDLSIARFGPETVKILVDKENELPEDFAIVWQCSDRAIKRDGKTLTTDSTQTMLNCSRIFMRENMTTVPYITLGCTADSTYLSGYDAHLDGMKVKVLYALTDKRNGNTYLMRDSVSFTYDFRYTIGYSQDAMIDSDVMPVSLTVYNTGATPITHLEGFLNDQDFVFDDVFVNPYTSQTLTLEYEIPENFNGLLRAHDVLAIFKDTWIVQRASRRGAPVRRSKKAEEDVKCYASGVSDVKCELLGHTIEGTVNKVYLELTDYDGLNESETVHVGLYTSHTADVPISSSAEVLLKANDFSIIGNERKAYVELTVDGLEEEQEVAIRARVYNDHVLQALEEDDDISAAIVDNLSWFDNQRIIRLLPTELDDVTGLPVVNRDNTQHKVKVEQAAEGIWIIGLEEGDYVRIFDAAGMPVYQQPHPTNRLFVPLREHGVYLLSTGQEIVKFSF